MALSEDGKRRLREAIQRTRPWERSTGPRTERGKRRVAQNSLKHGQRSREAMRPVMQNRAMLRLARQVLAMDARETAEGEAGSISQPYVPHVPADKIDETLVRRAISAAKSAIAWRHPKAVQLAEFVEQAEQWLDQHISESGGSPEEGKSDAETDRR